MLSNGRPLHQVISIFDVTVRPYFRDDLLDNGYFYDAQRKR